MSRLHSIISISKRNIERLTEDCNGDPKVLKIAENMQKELIKLVKLLKHMTTKNIIFSNI